MAEALIPAGARAGMAVVTLPAEIDMANAGRVDDDPQAAFAPGITIVVADMTATTFCDSLGIGTLVRAYKRAATSGAEFRVVVPSARVLRVLALLGLDRRLAIYPSLPEALAVQPTAGG